MTQPIKLVYRNILENSTVTVTSENTSFPKYRLYDRDIGKLFKGNSTPTNFYITLDQGAVVTYEVDRLFIPAGHNLDTLVIKLQYSTDNFAGDVHDALSWTQSGAGLIDKEFTGQNKRYWRLNIASPASAPELPEMFLGKVYLFERTSSWGFEEEDQDNVEREESASGKSYRAKYGERRLHRRYSLEKITDSQKTNLQTWDRHTERIKAIYVEDATDSVFFAELMNGLKFGAMSEGRWKCDIELLEVLP